MDSPNSLKPNPPQQFDVPSVPTSQSAPIDKAEQTACRETRQGCFSHNERMTIAALDICAGKGIPTQALTDPKILLPLQLRAVLWLAQSLRVQASRLHRYVLRVHPDYRWARYFHDTTHVRGARSKAWPRQATHETPPTSLDQSSSPHSKASIESMHEKIHA